MRGKLLSLSSAAFYRLLSPERCKLELKSRHRTKPGSWLKQQVPVPLPGSSARIALAFYIPTLWATGGKPAGLPSMWIIHFVKNTP